MCLNHPCYERLNAFASSKPARIVYGVVLVLIVAIFCWRLLKASDQLVIQRQREASRLEIIPLTKNGLIHVNSTNYEEVQNLKLSIDKSFKAYDNFASNMIKCSYDQPISKENVCAVDSPSKTSNSFGPCSSQNSFSFHQASPCIFVKFKKVNDWVPKNFNLSALPKDMPEDLQNVVKEINTRSPMVWVSCEAETPIDVENAGRIKYFPSRGFPTYFFPYTGQDEYLEPLIAVQLENPARGIVIMIKCTAWSGDFQDSIKFELLVD